MSSPERSDGARRERKALRAYLRREIKTKTQIHDSIDWVGALQSTLDWLLSRQKRYDAKPGGLGRR